MSGLAVVFNRDGKPAESPIIEAMLRAVPYRGVDGLFHQVRGEVGLGFAKLAITPEDLSDSQPLFSPRTGCGIVADVRLDNRQELLGVLPDQPPLGISDSEVILRAYEAWGTDAVQRLLGDFAFAVWDPRHQRVVCARDTSGQRPLYYRVDSRTFAAASEIHQLFQDPSVPISPNEEAIRDFLVPINVYRNRKDQAGTFYEGIHSVPAGHVLVVTPGTIDLRVYWNLSPRQIRYRTEEGYAEHFRDLFFDAVRARLRSAYPIGVFLSGGLDSSSVTCVAQQIFRQGQADNHGFGSYSIVFDGLECDERDLIRDVQAKYGFTAKYFPAGDRVRSLDLAPKGFLSGPSKAASEMEPIVEAAHRDGLRVLLSGDVGDAAILGSPLVFDLLLRQGRFRELPRHYRLYRRWFEESLRKTLALYTLLPLLPVGINRRALAWHAVRTHRRSPYDQIPYWLTEDRKAEISARELEISLSDIAELRYSNPAQEATYRALYPPEVCHDYAGWPLQNFRPFADRRIHEFLLAIPGDVRFRPHPDSDEHYAAGKRILRAAMRGILPERVRTRLKPTHFAALFDEEVRREWASYEEAFNPAGHSEVVSRGYVDGPNFWKRLNDLRFGFWGWDLLYIYRILWLETWLRSLSLPRQQLVAVQSRFSSTNTSLPNLTPIALP